MPSDDLDPTTRRRLLRRLGVAGALSLGASAGCLAGEPGGDGSGASTATPSGTTDGTETPSPNASPDRTTNPTTGATVSAVGGVRVSVADPVARKAVAYESVMGSGGVLAPEDRQFVVAACRSGDASGGFDAAGDPPRDAFSLVVGDETYLAVDIEDRTVGGYTASLAGRGSVAYGTDFAASYARSRSTGWLAFDLPSPLAVDSAAIRCEYGGESATWELPDDAVAALSEPAPTFELRSFDAVRRDGEDAVRLSLVAENTAEVAGEFLAAVYLPTPSIADDDESHLVRQDVDAGGRVEWSKRVDMRYVSAADGEVEATVEGTVTGATTADVGTRTSG